MSECNHDCGSCASNGSCAAQDAEKEARVKANTQGVKKVIGVVGGKGGVGKSLVTSLMAIQTQRLGYKAAVLDADITGPSAAKIFGEERIGHRTKRTLGGEDFSFLCRKKPGMMFRLGSTGENPDTHLALHSVNFDIDEACLSVGIDLFTQFVLDNMDGIEGL